MTEEFVHPADLAIHDDTTRSNIGTEPSRACLCDFIGPAWKHMPNTGWCGTMDEARRWAAGAHEGYRKAVVVAAFEAMSKENQRAFLAYLRQLGSAA